MFWPYRVLPAVPRALAREWVQVARHDPAGRNSIFAVDDCNGTIERAKTLGGSSIFVRTVPKHGRIGSLGGSAQ